MAKFYLFSEDYSSYTNPKKFYSQGSSPKILKEFINYIEKNQNRIDSIYLCLYLYNNPILDAFLEQLSIQGIKIRIVSIPLEGYDASKPQDIYNIENGSIEYSKQTKYSFAKRIYNRIRIRNDENFKLYIFPHMYIRSQRVKPFSRGNMPYSLHTKSVLIKFKDGTGVTGLTSSNLAARDLIKDEVMLLIEDDVAMNLEAESFFRNIINYSYTIKVFDEMKNWMNFSMPVTEKKIDCNNYYTYYTAPFYKDSQNLIEEHLIKLLHTAKHRILICAQHICSYNYFYNADFSSNPGKSGYVKKSGILNEVIKKSKEGLIVKCLSQTFVDAKRNSHNCRRPENVKAFMDFIREYEKNKNSSYAVNSSVHSKYIVIDDMAIITTCNFTPTQFIYLDKVNIEKFDNIPNISYCGIHSEVGQFLFVRNKDLCNILVSNFDSIWDRPNTYHHKNGDTIDANPKRICPKCNSELKKRNGIYGEFWGCSSFPNCKYTENI